MEDLVAMTNANANNVDGNDIGDPGNPEEPWITKIADTKPSLKAKAYLDNHLANIRACVDRWGDLSAFNIAYDRQDGYGLKLQMEEAWFNAPESRRVYGVPGFTEMCNLIDGTVPGLTPELDYQPTGFHRKLSK
jgi:hypothetical protein